MFKSHYTKTNASNSAIEFRRKWHDIETHYQNIIDMYIKERNELLKPFINSLQSSKQKRSALGFMAGSTLSLLMGGITEIQIYKINQHVHENKMAIETIKQAILAQQSEIKTISGKVTGFIKDITQDITFMFQEQTCTQFYSSVSLKIKHEIDECMRKIDDTLWSAISGQNYLSLTPRMLNIHMLKKLVEWNTVLNNTIYDKEPSFLYSLASISLVELEQRLNYAHFVIQIPIVKESSITNFY